MPSRASRRALAGLIALACVAAPSALVASCGSLPQPQLCGEIPANGCPVGRGGTCEDLTCAALYDCVGGAWTLSVTCPAPEAGPTGSGGSDASAGASDGGGGGAGAAGAGGAPCTPFEFNHTGELDNCRPSLETPDCPAAAAEGCREMACDVDCQDFYLCKQIGWVAVGYCDADGGFHDTQRHAAATPDPSR